MGLLESTGPSVSSWLAIDNFSAIRHLTRVGPKMERPPSENWIPSCRDECQACRFRPIASLGPVADSLTSGRTRKRGEHESGFQAADHVGVIYASSSRTSRATALTNAAACIAPADLAPCFQAFRLPLGAPGEGPPCIRQRPLGIAGDLHGVPLRVRAPQRLA